MRELVICLALFTLAVIGFFVFDPYHGDRENVERQNQEDSAPVFEPNIVRRDVTPKNVLPAPTLLDAMLERLPAVEPPPPPKRAGKAAKRDRLDQVSAVAPGILTSGNQTITLSDIDPIPLQQRCLDQSGVDWPCGMLARTEMRLLLRGRAINCLPKEDMKAATITTRCSVGGVDMSKWLVLTGWATPHGELFKAELEEAKAKKRGQWREGAP